MKTKSMEQSENTDAFTHADPDMYALGTKHTSTKSQTHPARAVCLSPDLFKTPAEEEMRTTGPAEDCRGKNTHDPFTSTLHYSLQNIVLC